MRLQMVSQKYKQKTNKQNSHLLNAQSRPEPKENHSKSMCGINGLILLFTDCPTLTMYALICSI